MVRKTQRVRDPKIWGPVMDGESLRVGDPKIWGAGVDGDPKGWEILIEGEQQWMGNP